MAQMRIKSYKRQVAEELKGARQRRRFRRNQVFGLLLLAAGILLWRLYHTNPTWIFPQGWWRP